MLPFQKIHLNILHNEINIGILINYMSMSRITVRDIYIYLTYTTNLVKKKKLSPRAVLFKI